jgi:hypothetical protein
VYKITIITTIIIILNKEIIMNTTFVGEVTSILKVSDGKLKYGVTWKKSSDKYSSEETVYLSSEDLQMGQKVFVNFRTESENILENNDVPQPTDFPIVGDGPSKVIEENFKNKLDKGFNV